MVSCQARVGAKAIKCDTREIIAAEDMQASGVAIAEHVAGKVALKKAGNKLADYLIEEITKNWAQEVQNSINVKMIISGINFNQL